MSTVLNVVKSACYRWGLPFPAAGTLYNNTDPGALQLLHILYAVCEELRQAACWTQQKKVYSFSTTSGRSQYALPQDFYAASPFVEWNTDQNTPLYGIDDVDFGQRLYGGYGSANNFDYRFFGPDSNVNTLGGQFNVYPTPTSTVACSFEYLSRNLFTPKAWLPSTAYTSGQYVFSSGNIYLCDTNGTSHASTPVSGTAQDTTDGTTRWDYQAGAYEAILADTDLCIFDEDLIKLGLRAKWRDEKGEEAEKAEAEYQSKITKAVNRLRPLVVGSFSKYGGRQRRYSFPSSGGFI